MKTALVTVAFPGRPDGQAEVRNFNPGDECHGDLAQVAVNEGWAEPLDGEFDEPPVPPKAAAKADTGKGQKTPKKAKGGDGGEGEGQ